MKNILIVLICLLLYTLFSVSPVDLFIAVVGMMHHILQHIRYLVLYWKCDAIFLWPFEIRY